MRTLLIATVIAVSPSLAFGQSSTATDFQTKSTNTAPASGNPLNNDRNKVTIPPAARSAGKGIRIDEPVEIKRVK